MYSELEVTQIINKIVKIVDETEGIRERGIYLSANICPDEGGAVRLMVDIRMENGYTISPLCRRIRISELLKEYKNG